MLWIVSDGWIRCSHDDGKTWDAVCPVGPIPNLGGTR